MRKMSVVLLVGAVAVMLCCPFAWSAKTLKIGFNIPLTGDIPKVGESSKFAAEILKAEINKAGGIKIGAETYQLEFVYEDNESKAESATAAALKLITQDQVLAIIGPQSSKQAIPDGEICNNSKTPMISPWSTNPKTTENPLCVPSVLSGPLPGAGGCLFPLLRNSKPRRPPSSMTLRLFQGCDR